MLLFNPAMRMLDRQFGEPIRYWQCQRCPCYDPDRGTWNRTHPLCGGVGLIRTELDVSRYVAIVTGAETARQFTNLGPLEVGTLVCSAYPDEIPLAPDDQVLVPTRTARRSEVHTAGSDILYHHHPTSIVSIYAGDGLVTATSYSLSGNQIVWSAPLPAGTRYSCLYDYNPLYQVIEDARLNRAPDIDGTNLPRRVLLKPLPVPQPTHVVEN